MKSANWINKTVSAAALALGVAVSGSALAALTDFPEFTINENSVPGTSPLGNSSLTVDQLNGNYTENFTPTFTSPTGGTFTSDALFTIQGYFLDHSGVTSLLNCTINIPLVGNPCYNMYATFTADGTFVVNPDGSVNFTGTSATIGLYVDPDQVHGNADDYLVASSNTLLSGKGQFTPGSSTGTPNGNFEILWEPVLLTTTGCPSCGDSFFTAPRPFYLIVDANGNFTENPLQGPFPATVSGSANAFFMAVPEPTTVLLLGIGLLGVGLTKRRFLS